MPVGHSNAALWNALTAKFTGRLSVRYCYCSAFDQCWVTSAVMGGKRDLNPPRVRECPRPKVPYDNTAD